MFLKNNMHKVSSFPLFNFLGKIPVRPQNSSLICAIEPGRNAQMATPANTIKSDLPSISNKYQSSCIFFRGIQTEVQTERHRPPQSLLLFSSRLPHRNWDKRMEHRCLPGAWVGNILSFYELSQSALHCDYCVSIVMVWHNWVHNNEKPWLIINALLADYVRTVKFDQPWWSISKMTFKWSSFGMTVSFTVSFLEFVDLWGGVVM